MLLVWGEADGCFAFLWFVACVLSVKFCLLPFLASLVYCSVIVAITGHFLYYYILSMFINSIGYHACVGFYVC